MTTVQTVHKSGCNIKKEKVENDLSPFKELLFRTFVLKYLSESVYYFFVVSHNVTAVWQMLSAKLCHYLPLGRYSLEQYITGQVSAACFWRCFHGQKGYEVRQHILYYKFIAIAISTSILQKTACFCNSTFDAFTKQLTKPNIKSVVAVGEISLTRGKAQAAV